MSVTQTPVLSQANAVGQGFDVYATLDAKGLIAPLVDVEGAQMKTFTFLGVDYLVPVWIDPVEDTSGYEVGGTYLTRESLQNALAAHAGVSASYGCFSGEMEADYSSVFARNTQYAYAFTSYYSTLAYLEAGDELTNHLSQGFRDRVEALPTAVGPDDIGTFAEFFHDFGAYFTRKITLGGLLKFFTSVSVSSEMSEEDIAAAFHASYDGLFVSGSIDASVKSSKAWQSYTQGSSTSISGMGGDPALIVALAKQDPLNPTPDGPATVTAWVKSLGTDPAIVDVQLAGIWLVCGDRSAVVQEAWERYGREMRPVVSLSTASRAMSYPADVHAAVPPILTVAGRVVPAPPDPPASSSGIQALILENAELADPAGVLFNRYFALPPDKTANPGYAEMYAELAAALRGAAAFKPGNVLVYVSFGLDMNEPPTRELYELLRTAGSTPALDGWMEDPTPGSDLGGSTWVLWPTNHLLVGIIGDGPGTGAEQIDTAGFREAIQSSLDVYFYRQEYAGPYTLGLG